MGLWLLYVSQEDRRSRSRGFKELRWVHFVGETSETEVVEFVESKCPINFASHVLDALRFRSSVTSPERAD